MSITAHRHVATAEAALDSPSTYRAEMLSAVRPLLPCRHDLEDADGATLAEDVTARSPLPLFDNSAMDGYAVRGADIAAATAAAPVILPVEAEVAAGDSRGLELAVGTCARIMTGAPIPFGADAVVRAEWTDGGTTKVTRAQLTRPVRSPAGRRSFISGTLDYQTGTITPAPGRSAHQLTALARANALIIVPEEITVLAEGATAELLELPS